MWHEECIPFACRGAARHVSTAGEMPMLPMMIGQRNAVRTETVIRETNNKTNK